jgi:tetratricopeptide (TPR) repeat protein
MTTALVRPAPRAGRIIPFGALCLLVAGGAACGSPPTATTLVAQGLKAQLSGDLASAQDEYRQAIHLDANSMVAHYDLGTVYDHQGKTAQAVAEYRATLVIDPNFTDALFNLAVDTAGSDPASAELLYRKVLKLQPSFAAAWLNVGFILQSEGKKAEAAADWAKAAAMDPSLAKRIPVPAAAGVRTPK